MISKRKNKLLILGVLPPPIGGVSIHLIRLLSNLNEAGVAYKFIDYGKNPILSLIYFLKCKYIHINVSNKFVRFILLLLGKSIGKRMIVTFHGKYDYTNRLDRFSLILSYKSFALNQFTYDKAAQIIDEKVYLVSAFIPPEKENNSLIESCEEFTSFISYYDYIICTNSHNYVIDKNGDDLYGIDIIIKAIDNKDIGLIISDPSGMLRKKYGQVEQRNILFLSFVHSFIDVIEVSHCFIRATTTDGDSLSVKEALYFGKWVIASDCVDRPEGCVLFPTGDIDELALCINNVRNYSSPQKFEQINGAEQLINFYKQLD